MSVTINGDGSITGLSVVPDPGANGVVVRTSSATAAARTITAGTGVSVANGDGVSGNPTITNSGVTAFSAGTTGLTPSTGTTGSVTLAGTLGVANGGTGQTTYTNGQLLIGNTTGNTLAKATLTAGTGVSVTNGAGSITIANSGVTSVAAGTGISVSASTGGVTISSTVSGGVTSITAGSGLTGGTITSSGTIALDYYTGSSTTNTSFPIGSYVFVYTGNQQVGRNQSNGVYFYSNTSTQYESYGSYGGATALAGTWRGRGQAYLYVNCTAYIMILMQRTA